MTETYEKKLMMDAMKEGCWYRHFPDRSWWRLKGFEEISETGASMGDSEYTIKDLFHLVETKPFVPEKRKVKKTFYRSVWEYGDNLVKSSWHRSQDKAETCYIDMDHKFVRLETCEEEVEE